jgi:ketosteroid isomerase-like protein
VNDLDQSSAETRAVLDVDDRFFGALLAVDRTALEQVLAPDFLLVDVMTGSEIPREFLVDAVGARQLVFEAIARTAGRVRHYGSTAIVVGETRMRGRYGEQSFVAHSRYTHVFVKSESAWLMVAAQGTPIAPASA